MRNDHEMIKFKGRLIPVLGTVGGTREESIQTARNIEQFFARGLAAQRAVDREIKKAGRSLKKGGKNA